MPDDTMEVAPAVPDTSAVGGLLPILTSLVLFLVQLILGIVGGGTLDDLPLGDLGSLPFPV